MATRSAEFLEVDDYENAPGLHRSRSGGYVDFLEEQAKWDRRDRERQMKRYHDSRYAPQSQQATDRLYVPAFDTGHRRVRSHDHIIERKEEPAQDYKVREVAPGMSYDLESKAAGTSELPVRQPRKHQQRKPSIRVQIHQDEPPTISPNRPTPKKSPRASPRSPNAVPQLLFQYSTLQHKLARIDTTCSPFVDVEAANPRDLTFGKISEQVKGFAFELETWSHVINLEDMSRIDSNKWKIVDAASRTLDRLIHRATDLSDACATAKPRDLKAALMPVIDDLDDGFNSNEDDDDNGTGIEDVTESPAFVIQSSLDGIQTQIQTLKRLSRSLQEATPIAKDEVIAVNVLVAEVGRYFGSQEALDRYQIDTRFAGRKALEEARYAAGK